MMLMQAWCGTTGAEGQGFAQPADRSRSPHLWQQHLQSSNQQLSASSAPQATGLLAHSAAQQTLQQPHAQSGPITGPMDWQHNALYALDSLGLVSAEDPACITPVPVSHQSPKQDTPAGGDITQPLAGLAHADTAADAYVSRANGCTSAAMQSSAQQHVADAEAAGAAASISPEGVAARHAVLKTLLAASRSGTVCQQPEQTVMTEALAQSEATSLASASLAQPNLELASLPGLSLAEAKQLLHLISSLQAAGALAEPSAAVAKATPHEQLAESEAAPPGECMKDGIAESPQASVPEQQQQQVQTCIELLGVQCCSVTPCMVCLTRFL